MAGVPPTVNSGTRKRKRQHVANQISAANSTAGSKHNHKAKPRKRQRIASTLSKRKSPGLFRPKTASSFELPQHLVALSSLKPTETQSLVARSQGKNERSRSSTPTISQNQSGTEPAIVRLGRISILMTAVHRRNKNQHRNQPFYKHFSMLRQSISKLTALYERSLKLSGSAPGKPSTKESVTAASIRERFEKESQLRSQREVLEEYIRETLVPVAYVTFTAVVADSQFANLGIVLLGLLADVTSVVGTVRRTEGRRQQYGKVNTTGREPIVSEPGKKVIGVSTRVTGPDRGSVVERVYDSDRDTTKAAGSSGTEEAVVRTTAGRDVDIGEVIPRESTNTRATAKTTEGTGKRQYQDTRDTQTTNNTSKTTPPPPAIEHKPLDSTTSRNKPVPKIAGPPSIPAPSQKQSHDPELTPTDPGPTLSTSFSDPKSAPDESAKSTTPIPKVNTAGVSTGGISKRARDDRVRVKSKKERDKKTKNAIDDLFAGFG